MRILIVEDEAPTARKLERLLAEVAPQDQVVGITASVEDTVDWLNTHPAPDLLLLDIELAYGQSFDLFNRVAVRSPVIFTTAYDEYAIRAFRVNSIDYLLKPIKEDDLRRALAKLEQLRTILTESPDALERSLKRLLGQLTAEAAAQPAGNEAGPAPTTYRDRFLIRQGQRLFSVPVEEVAYCFSRSKLSFLKTYEGHEWMVEYTMDELERMLNPRRVFRLNRQVIAELRAIEKVNLYFNGKLKIQLRPATTEEVLVSRERAVEFKAWLGE